MLLRRGANVQLMDDEGYTPLHEAAKGDDPVVIRLLLEAGADRSIKNKKGESPSQIHLKHWQMKKKIAKKHREIMDMLES
ncbi:ankyrin [Penicillium bovifimosum]|uniref:Ankyrin n=1 Tax=Penicillium bovifimosum TaxID=126998 RepID=A0A9W9GVS4_9EURO|nr:ankyrin [Penicillium bovifimosum]KAJ5130977.1 ankyrin [Penicillium bovifimosum]